MAERYSYLCWMVLEWFNLKPHPRLYVLSSFSSDQAADLYSFDKGGSGFSPKSYSLVPTHLLVQLSDNDSSKRIPLIATVKSLCLPRLSAFWLEWGDGVENHNSET